MKKIALSFTLLSACLLAFNAWAGQVTWQVTNKAPYPVTIQYFSSTGGANNWTFTCDNIDALLKAVVEPGKTASLSIETNTSVICINTFQNDKQQKSFETWGASWPQLYYSASPFNNLNPSDSEFNPYDPCPDVTNKEGVCDVSIPMPLKPAQK